jgi:hypothetical protein
MSDCSECKPSTLTIHGEKILRAELKRQRNSILQLEKHIEVLITEVEILNMLRLKEKEKN